MPKNAQNKQIYLLTKYASAHDEEKASALIEFAEGLSDEELNKFLNPFCVLNIKLLKNNNQIISFTIDHKEIFDPSRQIKPFIYNAIWQINECCLNYPLHVSRRIKNASIKIGISWIKDGVLKFWEKSDERFMMNGLLPNYEDTYSYCLPLVFIESKDLKPHNFDEKCIIRGWTISELISSDNADFRICEHPTMRDILRSCFRYFIDNDKKKCFHRLFFDREREIARGVFQDCVQEAEEYLYRTAFTNTGIEHEKKPELEEKHSLSKAQSKYIDKKEMPDSNEIESKKYPSPGLAGLIGYIIKNSNTNTSKDSFIRRAKESREKEGKYLIHFDSEQSRYWVFKNDISNLIHKSKQGRHKEND